MVFNVLCYFKILVAKELQTLAMYTVLLTSRQSFYFEDVVVSANCHAKQSWPSSSLILRASAVRHKELAYPAKAVGRTPTWQFFDSPALLHYFPVRSTHSGWIFLRESCSFLMLRSSSRFWFSDFFYLFDDMVCVWVSGTAESSAGSKKKP